MMSHSFDGIREILFLILFDFSVESDQNVLFSCVVEDSHVLKHSSRVQAEPILTLSSRLRTATYDSAAGKSHALR